MVEKENNDEIKETKNTDECGDNCGHDHKDLDINETIKQMGDLLYHNTHKKGETIKDTYKFWDTQPVPKIKEVVDHIGPIDDKNDWDGLRKTPLNLPNDYYWHDININDKKELQMVR